MTEQMTLAESIAPAFTLTPADLSEKAQIYIEAHNITIKTSVSKHGDLFIDVGGVGQEIFAFWHGENDAKHHDKVVEEVNQFVEGSAA